MRDLKFMWKDESSVQGDCPALYEVDGGHIVVGKLLTGDELAEVRAAGAAHDSGIGADETAVFLPANVLNRLRSA
ncbi:lipid A biosynthesis lauroyl acyltransferase [Actinoplanes sp. NPDC023936]|uniref:lipid A biosynthesis lauroyl acyltransferase n=1 Tax=Actinoplanes sp. NPDC023936 TaxID=3154910 RepID=UPI0033C7269E